MMKLFGLLVTLVGLAAPLAAQGLQGEWRFRRQGYDGRYTGSIFIDRNNEARIKGQSELAYSTLQCGYVELAGDKVEIVFTSVRSDRAYSPDHFYCAISGGGALTCHNRDASGNDEPASFVVTRVGDLPDSPAGRLEDVCPPRVRPLSRARPSWNYG